jgi:hypothetical protein
LLAAYPDAVTRLRLPHTWRLGPVTTALIQPAFYPELPFDSVRPARHILRAGALLPELAVQVVKPMAGPGDPILAVAAAELVRDVLQNGVVAAANQPMAPLEPRDVAVITPHVEQASAVAARLNDVPEVLVLTANQAQGLEREAVVVIYPLAGYRETPAFALDSGRLCVALSRHRAHAIVIVDAESELILRHAQADDPHDSALALQRRVLDALVNGPDARVSSR